MEDYKGRSVRMSIYPRRLGRALVALEALAPVAPPFSVKSPGEPLPCHVIGLALSAKLLCCMYVIASASIWCLLKQVTDVLDLCQE
jgi:hypothetical protein